VIELEEAREYPPELLPPGEYALAYLGHDLKQQFGRSVLVVYFLVATHLQEPPSVVIRYYNVEGRADGKWRAPPHCDLTREFRRIFPGRRIERLDRFPVRWLKEQQVIGKIDTVEKNREGTPLHGAEYSVVRELLRCVSTAADR
jgi:hypothetical protein